MTLENWKHYKNIVFFDRRCLVSFLNVYCYSRYCHSERSEESLCAVFRYFACSSKAGAWVRDPSLLRSLGMRIAVFSRTCHSIFAQSLTRFAFRNPNVITYGYATFDLLLQNSSITKRCFVILSEAKNLYHLRFWGSFDNAAFSRPARHEHYPCYVRPFAVGII